MKLMNEKCSCISQCEYVKYKVSVMTEEKM